MNWKSQHHQKDHTAKVTLKFNSTPIKLSMSFFHRIRNNPKMHMEPKRDPHSKSKTKQKEQIWRHHII